MSFVYRQSEPDLWTVGHYAPDGTWEPESDHSYRGDAVKHVHYLNGGASSSGKPVIEYDGRWKVSVERQDDRIVVRTKDMEIIAFHITETGIKLDRAWIAGEMTQAFHIKEWAKYVRRLNLSTKAYNALIRNRPQVTVTDFELYVLDVVNQNLDTRGLGVKLRAEIEEALNK